MTLKKMESKLSMKPTGGQNMKNRLEEIRKSRGIRQEELAAILLLVGAYLLVQGYAVYWRIRLEKEM